MRKKLKMEGFFQKYIEIIDNKTTQNKHGCQIWQGCIKKGPVGYGVIKARFPDGKWHTMHVHRLRYLVHAKIMSVEPGLEVSHLCHEPQCVNVDHLSLEPHSINTDRQKCFNRGVCRNHGAYKSCLHF